MRERQIGLLRQHDQLFDNLKAALVGELLREVLGARRVGHGFAFAVFAREHALGQRTPDHHAHTVSLAGRQHVALDAAIQDGVRRLFGAETSKPAALRYPLGLDDLGYGKSR
ncbi:MAG: hypothetical protein K0S56_2381 [Microvirga sp.]|nr:hypothetical protein [Microvirga sp.]